MKSKPRKLLSIAALSTGALVAATGCHATPESAGGIAHPTSVPLAASVAEAPIPDARKATADSEPQRLGAVDSTAAIVLASVVPAAAPPIAVADACRVGNSKRPAYDAGACEEHHRRQAQARAVVEAERVAREAMPVTQ